MQWSCISVGRMVNSNSVALVHGGTVRSDANDLRLASLK